MATSDKANTTPTWLSFAFTPKLVRRSLTTSVVVGTILTIINQFDAIAGDAMLNWVSMGLTYLVPYCVSTFSGAMTACHHAIEKLKQTHAETQQPLLTFTRHLDNWSRSMQGHLTQALQNTAQAEPNATELQHHQQTLLTHLAELETIQNDYRRSVSE